LCGCQPRARRAAGGGPARAGTGSAAAGRASPASASPIALEVLGCASPVANPVIARTHGLHLLWVWPRRVFAAFYGPGVAGTSRNIVLLWAVCALFWLLGFRRGGG